MKKITVAETYRSFLLGFIALTLIAAIIVLPSQFRSEAVTVENNPNGTSEKTAGQKEGWENYDIRTDKTEAETLLSFRQSANRSAVKLPTRETNLSRAKSIFVKAYRP